MREWIVGSLDLVILPSILVKSIARSTIKFSVTLKTDFSHRILVTQQDNPRYKMSQVEMYTSSTNIKL